MIFTFHPGVDTLSPVDTSVLFVFSGKIYLHWRSAVVGLLLIGLSWHLTLINHFILEFSHHEPQPTLTLLERNCFIISTSLTQWRISDCW